MMEVPRSIFIAEAAIVGVGALGIGGAALDPALALAKSDHIARNTPAKVGKVLEARADVFPAVTLNDAESVSDSTIIPYNVLAHETPGDTLATQSTPSPLQQECIQDGLTLPVGVTAKMFHHGKRTQTIFVRAPFDSMNPDCNGVEERSSQVKFQLQDNLDHNKWFTMTFPHWLLLLTGNEGGTGAPSERPSGHEGDWIYYKCTPGAGKTHSRIFIENTVTNPVTNQIDGKKVEEVPVKVYGAC